MAEVPQRILVLFAHPALQKSRVNRVLLEGIRGIEDVTIHDLYDAYPDFGINVPREQALLVDHDIVVFHHPFFWYSTPAILKEWQDLVLQHGWAYGSEGTMLRGKKALSVITTGGGETAYHHDGHNRYTMDQFLAPVEQTFRLCGVEYLPPYVIHGTLGMKPAEIMAHAETYRRLVEALSCDTLELEVLRTDPDRDWRLDELLPDEREGA